MDLFTHDENIGHSYSERGAQDDLNNDEDEHESEEDELPGEITHEGGKVQVMRNEWREITTVKDRCKGHTNIKLTSVIERECFDEYVRPSIDAI